MKEVVLLIKIGKRIRKIRSGKNMAQNELALECDFEKSSMSRIEAGQANPIIRTLIKISMALEVPIAGFFI